MAAEIEGASHGTPHVPEGTAIKSTDVPVNKYLRSDGDDTSSWVDAVPLNYKITLVWEDTSGQTGVTYSQTYTSGTDYDTVEITHGLGTRDVLVDVLDLPPAGATNYGSGPYVGLDMGFTEHVDVTRNSNTTVKLVFGGTDDNFPVADLEYRVLVIKVG